MESSSVQHNPGFKTKKIKIKLKNQPTSDAFLGLQAPPFQRINRFS